MWAPRGMQRSSYSLPNKIIGEQVMHLAPPILHLKVTSQTVTFNTKNCRKLSSFWRLCPRPYCTLYIRASKNTYFIKLCFGIWSPWLFLTKFCSPTEKIVPVPKGLTTVFLFLFIPGLQCQEHRLSMQILLIVKMFNICKYLWMLKRAMNIMMLF